MRRPLEGIRVLDLTTMMAGPFGSMTLGDLGAEVIKIESPSQGDGTRTFPPYFHHGVSAYFLSLNRNKKSVTIDLKKERGREIFYRLTERSDVVYDNFRPGILTNLKIDYTTLAAINPRIICSSITAFGSDSPYGDRPAYDLTIQALSGVMSLTGEPGGAPLRMGIPTGDLAGALFSVIGIMGALRERDLSGRGRMVDISLLDSQLSLLTYQAAYYFLSGVLPEPLGSSHTSIVPFQAFKARDGYFCVAVVGERMWGRFCRAIERGELVADRRFASGADRLHHRRELTSELAGIFSTKSRGLWVERLQREGVPAAPVNNLAEALAEPAVLARNMVIEVDHRGEKVSLLGNPVKLDGMNEEYSPPAALGQDTEAVLGELGVRAEEFQALKDEGVV